MAECEDFYVQQKLLREPLQHMEMHIEHAAKDCTYNPLYFAIWKNLSPLAVATQEQLLKEGLLKVRCFPCSDFAIRL